LKLFTALGITLTFIIFENPSGTFGRSFGLVLIKLQEKRKKNPIYFHIMMMKNWVIKNTKLSYLHDDEEEEGM
jgi:hypothetical protein